MKKILLIASELGKGGAERSISLLSYYLSEQYDVTLCILSGTNREKYYRTCEKVVFIDPPPSKGLVSKLKAWQFRIKQVKALKLKLGIDVTISFLEGPNYINVLTKGKDKIILGVRGSKQFDGEIKGITGWLRKNVLIPFFYSRGDKVVCAAKELMQELHLYFKIPLQKLSYIYNLYDFEDIRKKAAEPLSEEEKLIFSKPVIINSGRLHIQKNQEALIYLVSRLRPHNIRLVILGDGERKQALLEKAIQLNLSVWDATNGKVFANADVVFLGYQPNAFKFFAHSTIFALSSNWEGFPNVMAEALICNLPVVGADCPTGPREILQVEGLPSTPTTNSIRKKVGSLMPLLQPANSYIVAMWEKEVEYWLYANKPEKAVFETFTSGLTVEAIVKQWAAVLEKL